MKLAKTYVWTTVSFLLVNLMFYICWIKTLKQNIYYEEERFQRHLAFNSKCKVPDYTLSGNNFLYYIQHYYIPCPRNQLLTRIVKTKNRAFLIIESETLNDRLLRCCYSNVTADIELPDERIEVSGCQYVENNTEISHNVIYVKCYTNKTLIYSNVHAIILVEEHLFHRHFSIGNHAKKPNFLIIGIGAMSRMHFIQIFPKTYYYLRYKDWTEYKIFNKVSSNNKINIIAMLTGKTYLEIDYNTTYITNSPFIWTDFKKMGYITAYAKDSTDNGIAQSRIQFFRESPTDFYFRPYVIATHMLPKMKMNESIYCTGPELAVERILNIAKDYLTTFIEKSTFGLFWMDSFSRAAVVSLNGLDTKLKDFFQYLHENKILQNTITFFLSDGGSDRNDHSLKEWYANQLPFLFIWIPPIFRRDFQEFKRIREASSALITHADIYLTMQEILAIIHSNYTSKQCKPSDRCRSLFATNIARSCKEASIDYEFCSCLGYNVIPANDILVQRAQGLICNFTNNKITKNMYKPDAYECNEVKPYKVNYAWISENRSDIYEVNNNFLIIGIETYPFLFLEARLRITYNNTSPYLNLVGKINGLDRKKVSHICKEI